MGKPRADPDGLRRPVFGACACPARSGAAAGTDHSIVPISASFENREGRSINLSSSNQNGWLVTLPKSDVGTGGTLHVTVVWRENSTQRQVPNKEDPVIIVNVGN